MYELIICLAVTWGGTCQEQRPVYFSGRDFCERAIVAAKRANPRITAIYCRPKT